MSVRQVWKGGVRAGVSDGKQRRVCVMYCKGVERVPDIIARGMIPFSRILCPHHFPSARIRAPDFSTPAKGVHGIYSLLANDTVKTALCKYQPRFSAAGCYVIFSGYFWG